MAPAGTRVNRLGRVGAQAQQQQGCSQQQQADQQEGGAPAGPFRHQAGEGAAAEAAQHCAGDIDRHGLAQSGRLGPGRDIGHQRRQHGGKKQALQQPEQQKSAIVGAQGQRQRGQRQQQRGSDQHPLGRDRLQHEAVGHWCDAKRKQRDRDQQGSRRASHAELCGQQWQQRLRRVQHGKAQDGAEKDDEKIGARHAKPRKNVAAARAQKLKVAQAQDVPGAEGSEDSVDKEKGLGLAAKPLF